LYACGDPLRLPHLKEVWLHFREYCFPARQRGATEMVNDGPPMKFVALWGVFALLMLVGQAQLLGHGVNIAMSDQFDQDAEPFMVAALN
jgi:hypothetical protein